jgi:20S proteasome alpha/beta subunit
MYNKEYSKEGTMNYLWQISLDDYLEIMEEAIKLGKERGKKEGDNLEAEFFEVAKKKGLTNKIKHLGTTEKDIDLLTGDLRENGLKILNMKEEERKRKNDL